MRDARPGQAGPRNIAKALADWNSRNDTLRMRRLGIQTGKPFNRAAATARMPFKLPPGYRVEEDGSVSRRGK